MTAPVEQDDDPAPAPGATVILVELLCAILAFTVVLLVVVAIGGALISWATP